MPKANLYIAGTIHNDFDGPERLEFLLRHIRPEIVAVEISEERVAKPFQKRQLRAFSQRDAKKTAEKLGLTAAQQGTLAELSYLYASVKGYEFFCSQKYAARSKKRKVEYIDLPAPHIKNKMEEVKKWSAETIDYDEILQHAPSLKADFQRKMSWGIKRLRQEHQQQTEKKYLKYSQTRRKVSDMESWYQQERAKRASSGYAKREKILQPPDTILESLDLVVGHFASEKRDEFMAAKVRELYHGDRKMLVVCGIAHLYGLDDLLSDLQPQALPLNEYNKI